LFLSVFLAVGLFALVLFLFISRTFLFYCHVLLHFMINCPLRLVGVALPLGADRSKQNSGEASGRDLESVLFVHSSQPHKHPQDSICHTKTDDQRLLCRTAPIWASAQLLQSSTSWIARLNSPNGPQ
jgi:hypothetical protein